MEENRVWGPQWQACAKGYLGQHPLARGQRLARAGCWPEVGPAGSTGLQPAGRGKRVKAWDPRPSARLGRVFIFSFA